MQHDPAAGLLAGTRVLDALYGKDLRTLEHLLATLRSFAESEEERAMEPDEFARMVIERERIRMSQNWKTRRAGGG